MDLNSAWYPLCTLYLDARWEAYFYPTCLSLSWRKLHWPNPRLFWEELPHCKYQDLYQESLSVFPAPKQWAPLLFLFPVVALWHGAPGQTSHLYPVSSWVNGQKASLTAQLLWIHRRGEENSSLKFSLRCG